jgi:hypothetical protein
MFDIPENIDTRNLSIIPALRFSDHSLYEYQVFSILKAFLNI